jgi:hypothetical protein
VDISPHKQGHQWWVLRHVHSSLQQQGNRNNLPLTSQSVLSIVEVESVPARVSLVSSHGLGRGSLPLRPELPTTVHSTYERLTRRLDLLLYNTNALLECSGLDSIIPDMSKNLLKETA